MFTIEDTDLLILDQLDHRSLRSIYNTNKHFRILHDKLWIYRLYKNYTIDVIRAGPLNISPKKQYRTLSQKSPNERKVIMGGRVDILMIAPNIKIDQKCRAPSLITALRHRVY